jgi:hypothetical protein
MEMEKENVVERMNSSVSVTTSRQVRRGKSDRPQLHSLVEYKGYDVTVNRRTT